MNKKDTVLKKMLMENVYLYMYTCIAYHWLIVQVCNLAIMDLLILSKNNITVVNLS